jgi:hypothetical protein
VLDRTKASFGLTFGFDPLWGRVDDISGQPVNSYSADWLVIADRELIPDRGGFAQWDGSVPPLLLRTISYARANKAF